MSDMLRVIIVDDERLARSQLRRLLAAHPSVSVVGEAESVATAADLLHTIEADVLFLDIQLGGETGFDLLSRVDTPARVVFVTAWDQHAIQAFDVNAMDYLLKPVDAERLARTLARLRAQAPAHESTAGRPLALEDRLFVEVERRAQFVAVRDILAVLAADDYTTLVLRDGRSPLVSITMQTWEARLPVQHFVRVHRSVLVQFAAVARIEPWSHGSYQVYLHGLRDPVPMSRRAASALRTRLR